MTSLPQPAAASGWHRAPLGRAQTLAIPLANAGYRTAFIGEWHMGNHDARRPGWTHRVAMKGQGEAIDPQLNVDGEQLRASGYVTDVLTDYALRFIRDAGAQPFLYSDRVFPRILQMGYQAVRTERYKYVDYLELEGADELYDLANDPFELNNIIATDAGRGVLPVLQSELARLQRESGCRADFAGYR